MTVDKRFPFQKLDVYVVAREMLRVVSVAAIRDAELRDQATRAAKSAFLNLAEGLPSSSGPTRRKHFESARASTWETVAAVDAAHELGAVSEQASSQVHALAWKLDAMLKALTK